MSSAWTDLDGARDDADRRFAQVLPLGRLTEEEREILTIKREFAEELRLLGLNERNAARLLRKSPTTICGWCDPRDRKRYPPKHIFRVLARRLGPERGREVLRREAESSLRAATELGGDDCEKTGTDD